MSKITIGQKMSNTGTIYDLAADGCDIVIDMGEEYQYIVVLPSHYGSMATRHTRPDLAIKKYNEWANQGYKGATILNRDGETMEIDFDDNLHILT